MVAITLLLLAMDFDSLGRAEFQAGNYRTARKYFEKQLPLFVDQPEARAKLLANLAQTYRSLGELSRAEKAITEASAVLPNDARLWHIQGQILVTAERYAEAEPVLLKAMALADGALAPAILGDLATLYETRKRYPAAINLLERGIASLEPGQARARLLRNLGVIHFKNGAHREAARDLEQSLAEAEQAVGPNHQDIGQIAREYAIVLAKLGRGREAKSYSQRAEAIKIAFMVETNSNQATVHKSDLK